MAKVAVIGDGPGGLSAALFLAKAGQEVLVFGRDETAMHHAFLYNYLGVPAISGTDFQTIARRQVEGFGATIHDSEVIDIVASAAGFEVSTRVGTTQVDYLILSEGKQAPLAESLGLAKGEDGITVDRNGCSSVDRAYVVGRSARPSRSQVIISAGDGAAAALDILSTEGGKDTQDWDTPPKSDG